MDGLIEKRIEAFENWVSGVGYTKIPIDDVCKILCSMDKESFVKFVKDLDNEFLIDIDGGFVVINDPCPPEVEILVNKLETWLATNGGGGGLVVRYL